MITVTDQPRNGCAYEYILNGEVRDAVFSGDGKYRYLLRIKWDDDLPPLVVIGLNPSTATEKKDDATVRRWKGYAKSWGYGGIVILNLFAYRSTNPADLKTVTDPIGPDNNATIDYWCHKGEDVLCSWGNHGIYLKRCYQVADRIASVKPVCLGTSKGGHPLHPLRLRKDLLPIPFEALLYSALMV